MGFEAAFISFRQVFMSFLESCVLPQDLRRPDEVPKCIWSNNLIHMVEVIPHVNIQLNMLSHSPRSVDLSLPNRCCLNRGLCKFRSLPNFSSPSTVAVCVCMFVQKKRKKEGEVSHISDHFTNVQYSPVGGRRYAHTGLILVITVDHIAASVNLNYAATVLASEDSPLCGHKLYIVQWILMSNSNDDHHHAFTTVSSNLAKAAPVL